MERAEKLAQQPVNQPQHAEEPREPQVPTLEEAIASLPPRMQRWYRNDPELATNPEKAAKLQYMHHVARREVGEEFTDPYFDRMESMLGLAPSANGQARPIERPSAPAPAPRRVEQPVRQQRSAVPMSAPVHREVPSMSSGRPQSFRAPLTRDELLIAQQCGQTPAQYQEQKERMLRMKASGEIQG